jgi:hypothetical protein
MPPRHGRDAACLQAARLLKWGLLAIRLSQVRTEIAGSTIRRLLAEWMGLFPKPTANPVTLGLLVYWAVDEAVAVVAVDVAGPLLGGVEVEMVGVVGAGAGLAAAALGPVCAGRAGETLSF